MPFIAYCGRLGISRELATFDSHNSEQALLISSYFNSLEKEEDVSLSRMYDLHLFLQENGYIWRALGQASSWTQAERKYNALEEMESKLH